ncbi:MAG: tRNA preQ1(34) S-adenosylmethionine ribosyltransferase-isomerase QueA [Thermoanaerobaculales bacterium]|jgi:S-adenosylmethionine:tRNA ribosyltransferase-isomerase|nr:tRNA preQ1(34) S-adenosylmethionine ribosyltransferase-isomerase QueA [Thermoanaerobaculales bacterium]
MRTADFDYELPPDRIAQQPAARGSARLLVLDRSAEGVDHRMVADLPALLDPGDLLLLNDTRVIPARLYARRPTGRRFELLLLRELEGSSWESLLRPGARAREGERLQLADGGEVALCARRDEGRWEATFEPPLTFERLDTLGEMPLPPYIQRPDGATDEDRETYQTVYAAAPGAVAAPTAGLHFTEPLLQRTARRGIELAFVTLHVGLGTFRPVTAERVADHRMHSEWYHFSEETARLVNSAVESGRRIVCVGTTSVRALEGALAAGDGRVVAGEDWTDIFITPGFAFRGAGAMLTNFHLPKSTLVMMISAFAGKQRVFSAYDEAVASGYRFFSYGDAMLIL